MFTEAIVLSPEIAEKVVRASEVLGVPQNIETPRGGGFICVVFGDETCLMYDRQTAIPEFEKAGSAFI